MKQPIRYILVFLCCLCLSSTALEISSFANMAVGVRGATSREVVNCYFGAFRKDGQIMVNMVPGAAGKVYRMRINAPVTLNGASVGQKYIGNGMPIKLVLSNRTYVEEIQVRVGDK